MKKAVKIGFQHAHNEYKRARSNLNKSIRNPKGMRNTINNLMNKKSKTTNITELNVNGDNITTLHDIANTLKA